MPAQKGRQKAAPLPTNNPEQEPTVDKDAPTMVLEEESAAKPPEDATNWIVVPQMTDEFTRVEVSMMTSKHQIRNMVMRFWKRSTVKESWKLSDSFPVVDNVLFHPVSKEFTK